MMHEHRHCSAHSCYTQSHNNQFSPVCVCGIGLTWIRQAGLACCHGNAAPERSKALLPFFFFFLPALILCQISSSHKSPVGALKRRPPSLFPTILHPLASLLPQGCNDHLRKEKWDVFEFGGVGCLIDGQYSCAKHLLKHFHVEAIVRLRRTVLRNLLCKPLKKGKEIFYFPLSSSQASVCEDCFSVLAHSMHSLTSMYFRTSMLNLDLKVTVVTREATKYFSCSQSLRFPYKHRDIIM